MYFSPYDEFPHVVDALVETKVPNGSGGFKVVWLPGKTINALMDTPSSKEQLYAMQMAKSLDRFMYYPYGVDLSSYKRFSFDGVTYETAGASEDQGGMHEVMRVALKKVT